MAHLDRCRFLLILWRTVRTERTSPPLIKLVGHVMTLSHVDTQLLIRSTVCYGPRNGRVGGCARTEMTADQSNLS